MSRTLLIASSKRMHSYDGTHSFVYTDPEASGGVYKEITLRSVIPPPKLAEGHFLISLLWGQEHQFSIAVGPTAVNLGPVTVNAASVSRGVSGGQFGVRAKAINMSGVAIEDFGEWQAAFTLSN